MKREHTWRRVVVSLVREPASKPYESRRRMVSGSDAAALLRVFLGDDPRERVVAIYLDAQNVAIGIHDVSVGTAGGAMVHPREVFGPAIALAASALIVAHNHPSGDPTPSSEDKAITQRLRDAGELLGIQLLDHIVMGTERFYTFADESFREVPK